MPEAYETLLLDAMLGDPTLFARHDFVEASWALITPINELWADGIRRPSDLRGRRMGTAGSRCAHRKGWPPMENAVAVQTPGRARTATVVAVGPSDRLGDVAEVLGGGENAGALHLVRIAVDGDGATLPADRPDVITIGGLRPEYVNNAIAGVRLSSLPTIVWWRGGRPEGLDGVASLADRVVLDADDPWPLWALTPPLFEHTVLTDIRWARLTRWRAALAHFFDLPAVREISTTFSGLSIAAADRAVAALFAGWLDAAFGWRGRIVPEVSDAASGAPIESVRLEGPSCRIELCILPNSTCLSTEGKVGSIGRLPRGLARQPNAVDAARRGAARPRARHRVRARRQRRARDALNHVQRVDVRRVTCHVLLRGRDFPGTRHGARRTWHEHRTLHIALHGARGSFLPDDPSRDCAESRGNC